MLSLPLNTVTPALRELRHGRKRVRAGRIGHDRDAGLRELCGGAARDVERHLAERIGVAHRDMPLHAERARARGDLLDLEHAEHVRRRAGGCRRRRRAARRCRTPRRAAPRRRGRSSPDRARRPGRSRPRPRHRAAPRCRDSEITPFCGNATSWMSMTSRYSSRTARMVSNGARPTDRIDHDVAAHLRGAVRDAQLELVAGAISHRRRGRHVLLLELAPARARRSRWCTGGAASSCRR